ncbi:hypothetical protein DFS34DRAFT_594258 [Phlyctochytrium arcticum]|nr:hypothetical protein DFS34DRAFT_594258 [Phlyctochytrium arcticum]
MHLVPMLTTTPLLVILLSAGIATAEPQAALPGQPNCGASHSQFMSCMAAVAASAPRIQDSGVPSPAQLCATLPSREMLRCLCHMGTAVSACYTGFCPGDPATAPQVASRDQSCQISQAADDADRARDPNAPPATQAVPIPTATTAATGPQSTSGPDAEGGKKNSAAAGGTATFVGSFGSLILSAMFLV